MIDKKEIQQVLKRFRVCAPLFLALSDDVRQQLLMRMADAGTDGMNVNDLTSKTHLSRPAVSHHLKVLKDAGLINSHKSGTQIFYYIQLRSNVAEIRKLLESMEHIIDQVESKEGAAAR